MGAFSTKKTLYGDTAKIPQVAEQIRQAFASEGYEVIEGTVVDQFPHTVHTEAVVKLERR